uniref:Uncharacterized protein n=1 Tax=Onchocerca volvulus TaxID=6282 RepID=A0A8R1TPR6_ONCVO
MNRKKYSKNEDSLTQSSQVVSAIDTFIASDYLVSNSMDNIEGMLKLLMDNPRNLTISKFPDNITQRTNVVEPITPLGEKSRRKAASIIRGFSAESMMRSNRQFMRSSAQGLKGTQNIKPQINLSSTSAPYVFIVGPVRVQTVQKIDGRSMNKLLIDEILELYGSGVKYPSKELITIKPKIMKSLPTTTKNIPITVQSVRVGYDYVRIDRKIELERSKIKLQQPVMSSKEVVKFGSGGLVQEKQEMKRNRWKSKSEAILLKAPVFNLIGPLVITAFQNAIHDTSDCYKIYEEIELRADGSTAKPEIAVIPFLRNVSVLPKNQKQQTPIKYQEDIFVGYNVMLIKRLIEIKPIFQKQIYDFSLSEERTYVTDKTTLTPSIVTESVISKTEEKKKALMLQKPSIKTDFTVSSKSDQSGKTRKISGTAGDSSEINDEGRKIIKKFDKFQIIRHSVSINGFKIGEISKRKYRKSKVSETPTEAFINADLHTARSPYITSKLEKSRDEDHALQAHSDSLHTGVSLSVERVKFPERAIKPSTKAELLTARSTAATRKPICIEDERKRSKESFLFRTKKPQLSKGIDSDSKIQQIDQSISSSMMNKAARSSKSISPPIIYPPTPPCSPRCKKKHKRIPDNSQDGEVATAILPDGMSSISDSSCTYESDSSMDDESMWRSVSEASPNAFISDQRTSKSKESSQLSDQSVPTTRSHLPDKPPLTTKKLETLSLLKGRQYRFNEMPKKKFLDVRSAEISSPKISSTISSTSSVSKEEAATDLKVTSAEVLLKSKKKDSYIVAENAKKRKFGLLPPTPSLISISSQRSSKTRSKESVALKPAISKDVSSQIEKKVPVTSKIKSKTIQSRFDRFPLQHRIRSRRKKSLSSSKRSETKRQSLSVTVLSDDIKSSEREPSKWFETDLLMDQSESKPQMQMSRSVIPVSSDTSKSSISKASIIRQALTSTPSMLKRASLMIPDTSAKEESKKKQIQIDRTKGTSIMMQSKVEGNVTIQLNINFQINNKENKPDDEKRSLKVERIFVKGREVYRKK